MTEADDDAAAVVGVRPRAPSLRELAEATIQALRRRLNPRRFAPPEEVGPGWILSRDPLVIYTARGAALGMASLLRQQLAGRPATFLVAIFSSAERPRVAQRIRRAAFIHRASNPEHRIIILCNTKEEQKILSDLGELAVFFNHNLLVGTDDFSPVGDCEVTFDAVYNARLSPQKRHHLSLKVDRCAMIFYRTPMENPDFERDLIERHGREAPGHAFINEIGPNGPIRLTPAEVNRVYNQAHVGLCLSALEGAMYASIEYLLAGLPIVSTRNIGGRDVYFDPEYCITTEADPEAIRAAVLELKARRIPRDHIRRRTLAKIEPDRQRFLDFLSALSVELPVDSRTQWPFPSKLLVRKPWKEFAREL